MLLPKKSLGLLALVCMAAASATGADDGRHSFARWDPDGYSYPCTVKKREQGRLFIRYTDGTEKWVPDWSVSLYKVQVGDTVYGNWKNRGLYYQGRVARRNGDKIRINYDDGDVEDTTIGLVRMKLVHPRAKQVGCPVLARWAPDGYSYPGVVKEIKGGKYLIHYDDGDKAWVEGRHVVPYLPTFGDRVEGNWLGKGKYYKGRIADRKGKNVRIEYDDGDVENTTIDRVRVDLSGVQLKTSE